MTSDFLPHFFIKLKSMNRLPNGNESDTSHSGWYDEMGATADQLFVVSTYTDFERLGEDRGRP